MALKKLKKYIGVCIDKKIHTWSCFVYFHLGFSKHIFQWGLSRALYKHPMMKAIVYFLFASWILLEEIDSTDGLGRVLKSGESCSSNSNKYLLCRSFTDPDYLPDSTTKSAHT